MCIGHNGHKTKIQNIDTADLRSYLSRSTAVKNHAVAKFTLPQLICHVIDTEVITSVLDSPATWVILVNWIHRRLSLKMKLRVCTSLVQSDSHNQRQWTCATRETGENRLQAFHTAQRRILQIMLNDFIADEYLIISYSKISAAVQPEPGL